MSWVLRDYRFWGGVGTQTEEPSAACVGGKEAFVQ